MAFPNGATANAGTYCRSDRQAYRARQRWPASIQLVAAVAAGVRAFHDALGRSAEGVVGPSQWEPGLSFPTAIGPDDLWFVRNFREQFGREPEYTAASSFATSLIFEKCVRSAGSFEDNDLLAVAAELDCYTFYSRFRLNSATGPQVGHPILLVQWDRGHKVLLSVEDSNRSALQNPSL